MPPHTEDTESLPGHAASESLQSLRLSMGARPLRPHELSRIATEGGVDRATARGAEGEEEEEEGEGTRVLQEDLEVYLRNEEKRDRLCKSIPFILLYFVVFNVMLQFHENIPDASQVERHIRGMMLGSSYEGYEAGPPGSQRVSVSGHNVLGDIDTPGDIYTFLLEALVPSTIPSLEAATIHEPNRLFRYNQLLGGVQLEQTRRGKKNCASLYPRMGPKDDLNINPFLVDFSCFRSVSNDDHCFGPGEALEGFCRDAGARGGRRLEEESLESMNPRLSGSVDISGPRYSLTLHEHQGSETALRRVRELADANWIDEQTSWVGLRFFMLNPDLAVYSRTLVGIFFLESGDIVTDVEVTTFLAEPYQRVSMLGLDVFWALLLAELGLTCMLESINAFRKRKQRGLSYFCNLWVLVDWACFVGGVLVAVLWFVYLGQLEAVKDLSMNVAVNRPDVQSGSSQDSEILDTYMQWVRSLHADVSGIGSYLAFFRFFLSFYNLLLVARFFEAFQTQPRLAIVTDTLLESLPDFLHFMVVFTTMLTSFAVAATFLFGHRLPEFSQVLWSIERCLLMIFGSLDYSRLAGEHPFAAFVWFISFMTLMFLIMLNMSLAVILDVYSGQIGAGQDAESLWHQLLRYCRRRKLVPARKVLEAVEELKKKEISEADLKYKCPNMRDQQAAELITEVAKAAESANSQATSITDATRMIVSVKEHVAKMEDQVELLIKVKKHRRVQLSSSLRGLSSAATRAPIVLMHPRANMRLQEVEQRLDHLEELMEDALKYTENRGRGLRDRLKVMEDQLRVRRSTA